MPDSGKPIKWNMLSFFKTINEGKNPITNQKHVCCTCCNVLTNSSHGLMAKGVLANRLMNSTDCQVKKKVLLEYFVVSLLR